MDEQWLWPGQAARILAVTPETVRRWAEKGALKSVVMPSGRRRIPMSEVIRLITVAD